MNQKLSGKNNNNKPIYGDERERASTHSKYYILWLIPPIYHFGNEEKREMDKAGRKKKKKTRRKIGANLSSKRLLNRIQFGKLHGLQNCANNRNNQAWGVNVSTKCCRQTEFVGSNVCCKHSPGERITCTICTYILTHTDKHTNTNAFHVNFRCDPVCVYGVYGVRNENPRQSASMVRTHAICLTH